MASGKVFNITGPCIPAIHYMADTSAKVDAIIRDYIEKNEYFTINRARQYGKTTTLELLYQRLKGRYVVMDMSFEGLGSAVFADENEFIAAFLQKGARSLEENGVSQAIIDEWIQTDTILRFPVLDEKIACLTERMGRELILIIDEIDKSSNNQLFMDFLGMLREKYIRRVTRGVSTFKSVILVSVFDVKNLKMKLRPEEQKNFNSPWNIAARFDVDLGLSVPEIQSMLEEYENDFKTGMDTLVVAGRLHYYTNGYPYLVSSLCKIMHEEKLSWTVEGVDEAEKYILKDDNTLFDDVIKNLVNHPSLSTLVESFLLHGEAVTFEISNPDIGLGVMLGILDEKKEKVSVSNIIFETKILNYYISVSEQRGLISKYVEDSRQKYVSNGLLDMDVMLHKFADFMKSEYRDEDGIFIERHGRLLFLSFLKPVINGSGHYAVEPETRGSRRMNVVVFYGTREYIVELKIWHGEQAAEEAYEQLAGYLDSRGQKDGYLLSFCSNRKSPRKGRIFQFRGHVIHEVIVAYRDKI